MPDTKLKPMQFIILLLFLLVLLSALTAQPSVIADAASIPTLLHTPTPTSIYEIPRWDPQVTPLPITTPDAPADQYTLIEWNTDTAYSALAGLRQHNIDYMHEFDAYQMLLVESYIRFPELFTDPVLFHELAYEEKFNAHIGSPAVLSDMFPPVSLYGQILVNALNNSELQIDEMHEWISANMVVEIKDSAVAENLIGEGSRSWVFSLSKSIGLWHKDFIVTQQADGTFISTSFPNHGYEQWHANEYNFDITDINGNGIPEIVEINFFPNFYEYENTFVQLSVYEWDGSQFVNLATAIQEIRIENPKTKEDLQIWSYEKQTNGSIFLIVKMKPYHINGCQPITESAYFRWTGRSYELDHTTYTSLSENVQDECSPQWMYTSASDPLIIVQDLAPQKQYEYTISYFQQILTEQNFKTRDQLVSWLYKNHIQWNGLRQIDMNQDGLQDWLVVVKIDLPTNGFSHLFALIQTEEGTIPIDFGIVWDKIETLQTSCHQYFPKDGSVPVQIYRLGSKVIAFQIITLGDQSYPFIHFEQGSASYEHTKIRGVEQNNDIITLFLDDYQEQYHWNNAHQKFELTHRTNENHYIEERILTMNDYDTAINILVVNLSEPPPEPFDDDTYNGYLISNHFYQLYTPYRTYLLGLAYELNGEEQKAVQTYWNLWDNYPESSFTIIAKNKLSPIE